MRKLFYCTLAGFIWFGCDQKKSDVETAVAEKKDTVPAATQVTADEEYSIANTPPDTVLQMYFSIDSDSLMISPGPLLDLMKQFRKTKPVRYERSGGEHAESYYATYHLGADSLTIHKEYYHFWIGYSNEQFYFKDDSLVLYRKYSMIHNEVTEEIYQFFQKKYSLNKRKRTTDEETLRLPNPYLAYFSLESFPFTAELTSADRYPEFMQRWHEITHPVAPDWDPGE